MRERKETENECRHTSWPDCLLPSHLCLCWWEDWGRRVWKSHTHTHSLHHAEAALFCLFRLIGGTDWASRRRLTFDVSFEKITPLRATDQSRWQCNFDLCMRVFVTTPPLQLIHPQHLRAGQHMSESGRKWGRGLRMKTITLEHRAQQSGCKLLRPSDIYPLLESQNWSLGIFSLKVNTLDFSSYFVRMLMKFVYITTKVRLQDSQCVCFQFKVNTLNLSSYFCKECLYNMFI